MERSKEGARASIIDAMPRITEYYRMKERVKMAKKLPKIQISDKIPLEEYDDSKETYVKFQRPARWESEQVDQLASQAETIIDGERRQIRQREVVPQSVLDSERVWQCLVDSNLPDPDGKQLFVPGTTCRKANVEIEDYTELRAAFYKAWYTLPDEVADEIATALGDFHPPFNWRSPGAGEERRPPSS